MNNIINKIKFARLSEIEKLFYNMVSLKPSYEITDKCGDKYGSLGIIYQFFIVDNKIILIIRNNAYSTCVSIDERILKKYQAIVNIRYYDDLKEKFTNEFRKYCELYGNTKYDGLEIYLY